MRQRVIYILPWWLLICLVAAAGAFGTLLGLVGLHVLDPFGDRARLELYRKDLLDGAPYTPWLRDLEREERKEARTE